MNDYIENLFKKHRHSGILIDTNLLVLLVIVTYNPNRILSHKRSNAFTLDDYALMREIVQRFSRRIITPNIMTETDNLVRQMPSNEYPAVANVMHYLIVSTFEVVVPSLSAARAESYAKLGLTDAAIISLAAAKTLILTNEFPLADRIARLGFDVVNFNHLRSFA
jgi:hypothetical protein